MSAQVEFDKLCICNIVLRATTQKGIQRDTLINTEWVWWCIFVFPVLRRLRQEDRKFKSSFGYVVRLVEKRRERKKNQQQ
jgi:hypothetical protein